MKQSYRLPKINSTSRVLRCEPREHSGRASGSTGTVINGLEQSAAIAYVSLAVALCSRDMTLKPNVRRVLISPQNNEL